MSKITKASLKNHAALAFASLGTLGTAAMVNLSVVNADSGEAMTLAPNVTAGSFDLTKQAGKALTFPVQFDRPSGVNAAALAGTVTQLGSGSDLYKSALAAVPELSNTANMNSLLSDALDSTSPNYQSARESIVKLINWYNSLGGQKITTQAGEAYTTANLDQPINVLAVAFSNQNSINQAATTALADVNKSTTVAGVEAALNAYQEGVSKPYDDAFKALSDKVYAADANLNDLSQYSSLKPVLDAYQTMYANGASAIRVTLLDGQAASTEAGVTFFESAVIAGTSSNDGGDGSTTNTVTDKTTYTTRWVDENGTDLSTRETSETGYGAQKDITNYIYDTSTTDDNTHTKTYVYKHVDEKTTDTVWVDENGDILKDKVTGDFPDNDGTSDIEGYTVISTKTTTDEDGNTHTVNTYHKVVSDTTWVDENGKELKEKTTGEFPDTEGDDITGYELVSTKTVTDANGDRHIINTYKQVQKTHTTWVSVDGDTLKPQEDGNHPDDDKVSDITGYTLVSTTTDEDGNTINTYQKTVAAPDTYWFDDQGATIKDTAVGQTLPDTDKNDIPGYDWQSTHTVTAEDLAEGGLFEGAGFKLGDTINIYKKTPAATTVHTTWVDDDGKELKPQEDGAKPDDDGSSDIEGYTISTTTTDADGNVINTYKKNVTIHTTWVDKDGKELKPQEDGAKPDNDGKSDIEHGDITNIYKKIAEPVVTPETPVSEAKTLPQTGTDEAASTAAGLVGASLLGSLGLAGVLKRRRNLNAK